MEIPALALLDRALELAAIGLPADSPVVLARARDLKLYFERLVAESETALTIRRRLAAWFRGLLGHELVHDRARSLVLDLVDPDFGASAEEVLAAVQTEQAARELAQWGRPLEQRERVAMGGLSAAAMQEEVSALIRDDLLRNDPNGFSTSAVLRRRVSAWLFVLLITGSMAVMLLWVLRNGQPFDPWYAAVHLVGTGVLAWWFSKDIFASARSAEAAVIAANEALRPRLVEVKRRA